MKTSIAWGRKLQMLHVNEKKRTKKRIEVKVTTYSISDQRFLLRRNHYGWLHIYSECRPSIHRTDYLCPFSLILTSIRSELITYTAHSRPPTFCQCWYTAPAWYGAPIISSHAWDVSWLILSSFVLQMWVPSAIYCCLLALPFSASIIIFTVHVSWVYRLFPPRCHVATLQP